MHVRELLYVLFLGITYQRLDRYPYLYPTQNPQSSSIFCPTVSTFWTAYKYLYPGKLPDFIETGMCFSSYILAHCQRPHTKFAKNGWENFLSHTKSKTRSITCLALTLAALRTTTTTFSLLNISLWYLTNITGSIFRCCNFNCIRSPECTHLIRRRGHWVFDSSSHEPYVYCFFSLPSLTLAYLD